MSIVDDYLIKVKKAFPIYGKNEKRFIADLKISVEEYLSSNLNCSENELYKQFGSPKEVAITYFENIGDEAYYLLVKKEHVIKKIFIAIIISLVIMCSIFVGFCYAAYQKSSNAVISEVRETIIEMDKDEESSLHIFDYDDGM